MRKYYATDRKTAKVYTLGRLLSFQVAISMARALNLESFFITSTKG